MIDIRDEMSLGTMAEFYGQCVMGFGIGELQNTHVLRHPLYQYRLRDFECPMTGCAHLVRRSTELEECFTDGKEMFFYDSIEECADKARFYISGARANRRRARSAKPLAAVVSGSIRG